MSACFLSKTTVTPKFNKPKDLTKRLLSNIVQLFREQGVKNITATNRMQTLAWFCGLILMKDLYQSDSKV